MNGSVLRVFRVLQQAKFRPDTRAERSGGGDASLDLPISVASLSVCFLGNDAVGNDLIAPSLATLLGPAHNQFWFVLIEVLSLSHSPCHRGKGLRKELRGIACM